MAALLGHAAEAQEYFSRAKSNLDATGRRPARAIADYDEALALIRLGSTNHQRIGALLDAAVAAFRELGIVGWIQRAENVWRRPQKPEQTVALTRRELEVLRLLARGRSSKEIAAELVVSVSTVERHVANIYAKIGVDSRVEAAAFALGRGFASPSGA
jgi:DNA-binding NarL/FixJ family response regulator